MLKELLKQIEEAEAESNIDVSSLNPGVQAMAEGMRKNAETRLEGLIDRYKNEVTKSGVIVAVSGEGAQKYAEMAKKAGWLTFDFNHLTNHIASSLKERSQSKVFGNQEWYLFMDELNQLKMDFRISNIPQPTINHTTDSVYEQPFKIAVDNLLKKNYAYSLHSAVAKRMIGDAAYKEKFDKEHLPVVLYNCSGVDQDFIPKPASVITVDNEITDKDVMEHIKKVAQIITPKKRRGRKPTKKGEANDQ